MYVIKITKDTVLKVEVIDDKWGKWSDSVVLKYKYK